MSDNQGFTRSASYQRLWNRLKIWLESAKLILIQGFVIALVIFSLLIAVTVIFRAYGYNAPVKIVQTDPAYLGILCPGDYLVIHNQVHVDAGVVAYFYISTTDVDGLANFPGTQTSYNGFTYIKEASFSQLLPWKVPNLPKGSYLRVTAARGSDGREKPSFAQSSYIIGDQGECTP